MDSDNDEVHEFSAEGRKRNRSVEEITPEAMRIYLTPRLESHSD